MGIKWSLFWNVEVFFIVVVFVVAIYFVCTERRRGRKYKVVGEDFDYDGYDRGGKRGLYDVGGGWSEPDVDLDDDEDAGPGSNNTKSGFLKEYAVAFNDANNKRKEFQYQQQQSGYGGSGSHNRPAKRGYKREERCREIFEAIFRRPFPSIRPNFLKNPATGKNLELDGFCPTIRTRYGMGLAFEHDGEQHAQYTPRFHGGNPQEFKYQYYKDMYKTKACRDNGILLVRIPHYVVYEDLDRFIRDKLRSHGVLTIAHI